MSFSSQDNDKEQNAVTGFVVGSAVLLAIAVSLFFGLSKAGVIGGHKQAAASAAVSAPAPAQGAGADEASVKVVDGVVRFYFASGKADIATGAKEALADAVAAAKSGKKLVLSGYHDSTGSAEKNAELAKKRAVGVRDALLAEGVAESSIELKKPEAMPNTKGSDPEARRVDVSVQ